MSHETLDLNFSITLTGSDRPNLIYIQYLINFVALSSLFLYGGLMINYETDAKKNYVKLIKRLHIALLLMGYGI